jgi:hypothetical protein
MITKASIKSNELVDIFHSCLDWNKSKVKFFGSFINQQSDESIKILSCTYNNVINYRAFSKGHL